MVFEFQLSKNKSFEFQLELLKNSNFYPFELRLLWTTKQDHAGPSFIFGIKYLFWVCLQIYDRRHWDHENNCWMKDDGIS